MFIYECEGIMLVVAIEEPPKHFSEKRNWFITDYVMLNVKNAARLSILNHMMMV